MASIASDAACSVELEMAFAFFVAEEMPAGPVVAPIGTGEPADNGRSVAAAACVPAPMKAAVGTSIDGCFRLMLADGLPRELKEAGERGVISLNMMTVALVAMP